MAVTRLERKGRKNKNVAKKRVNTMKRLSTKPVIKNIDVEAIKAEFEAGAAKAEKPKKAKAPKAKKAAEPAVEEVKAEVAETVVEEVKEEVTEVAAEEKAEEAKEEEKKEGE